MKASPFGDVSSSYARSEASFSPDGRWLAYPSSESGRYEVYVQPFPATGAKYQITKGGSIPNHHPIWSPDGKELFYVSAGRLFSVAIQTQPSFRFANPVPLPITGFQRAMADIRNYDITPDGKRFIVVFPPGENPAEPNRPVQIQVVLNWFEELKRRMSRQQNQETPRISLSPVSALPPALQILLL